jgi:hypothetical protein
MKKLTLTIGTVLAMAGAAFAQGTLNWNGTLTFSAVTAQTNSTQYSPLMGGGATGNGASGVTATTANGYYYELLYNTAAFTGSTVATPTLSQLLGGTWIDSALEAANSGATAGRIVALAGNPASVAAGTWAGGIGALGGATNNIVLVGWSANLGTSWLAVSNVLQNWSTDAVNYVNQNAFFGETSTGYIVPNIAPAVGATLFATTTSLNGHPIFSLNTPLYLLPVPEPATCALLGLGGLSMLLFRRRK